MRKSLVVVRNLMHWSVAVLRDVFAWADSGCWVARDGISLSPHERNPWRHYWQALLNGQPYNSAAWWQHPVFNGWLSALHRLPGGYRCGRMIVATRWGALGYAVCDAGNVRRRLACDYAKWTKRWRRVYGLPSELN